MYVLLLLVVIFFSLTLSHPYWYELWVIFQAKSGEVCVPSRLSESRKSAWGPLWSPFPGLCLLSWQAIMNMWCTRCEKGPFQISFNDTLASEIGELAAEQKLFWEFTNVTFPNQRCHMTIEYQCLSVVDYFGTVAVAAVVAALEVALGEAHQVSSK